MEGKGGDVPPGEMGQIMNAIAEDLTKKLKTKAAAMNQDLSELHELLELLIGEA